MLTPQRLVFARIALLAITAYLAACASVEPIVERGTVVKRSYFFDAAERDMEYTLYVPTNYRHGRATPLVVLLHGLGSNPEQVIGYQGIVEQAEKHGFIVVAPYGYNSGGWYGSRGWGKDFGLQLGERFSQGAPDNLGELSEKDVLNVLDLIRDEFTVDRKRIYLMGHSMGGGGTLYLGMKYAKTWAALAPMAPAIWSDPAELGKIKNTPIIVVQGDQDNLVPVAGTRRWVDTMRQLSMTHHYIEIPGGDHVRSISRNPEMMAEVFEFLAQHAR